jgi:DNA polymerase-3 subunit delta
MVKILAGTNWHALKESLDTLTSDFVNEYGEMALERIDAADSSYEQILGAVESLPFLSAKKMVVVEDLSKNTQASEAVEILLERAGDTTDLVIVEGKLDKRSAYYKFLKKQPSFHEYNELNENDLVNWLLDEANEKHASISQADARYLVQRVGLNQSSLSHELEKLVQYNPKIARQNIDMLTDEAPSSTIFNLIDSAFSGNVQRALEIYADQRAQKVEPQAIYAMLVWQMHAVSVCAHAPSTHSASDIAKDAGISPFVIQKSQSIARRMGPPKIKEVLEILREVDVRSKQQTMNFDEAMKYIIVSLAA